MSSTVKDIQSKLEKLMVSIMDEYKDEIQFNIRQRGLVLTGSLLNSVESRVVRTPFGLTGQIWLNDYGLVWETGVSRSRIDQFLGSKANAIAELTRYMRARGAVNPRGAAYATIQVWYREGAPTRASRRYSNAPGGERTRFISRAVESKQDEVEKRIASEAADIVLVSVTQAARKALRSFVTA